MAELLGLDWSSYKLTVTKNLKTLIQDQQFVDVTLHCEGKSLKAHKLYLSACSNYFKNILKETNLWQHPILFLSEIPFVDLQKILEFIYCGEIEIPQNRLTSFLKSAQTLKINGLIETLTNSNDEKHVAHVKKKKRRKESTEFTKSIPMPGLDKVDDQAIEEIGDSLVEVVVKADPDDFERDYVGEENPDGPPTPNNPEEDIAGNRGIIIRNDLLEPELDPAGSLYGERGRCHFCQLLCPDRLALTEHLKRSHQPPKHSLCENCENFFHICAITRHREKCQARYHTDK